eukprot:1266195-Pyramimonas_sp.AAC.1
MAGGVRMWPPTREANAEIFTGDSGTSKSPTTKHGICKECKSAPKRWKHWRLIPLNPIELRP